jgi:hypothetical protein
LDNVSLGDPVRVPDLPAVNPSFTLSDRSVYLPQRGFGKCLPENAIESLAGVVLSDFELFVFLHRR